MSLRLAVLGLFAAFAASASAVELPVAPPPRDVSEQLPVRQIRSGTNPNNLLIHEGNLYAGGFRAGRVTAVDLPTDRLLGEHILDAYERFVEREVDGKLVQERVVGHCVPGNIVHAGGKLFVIQGFSESLLVIDPDSMRAIKRLALGGEGRLAVTPDGKTVIFALNLRSVFHRIDVATYEHTTVEYPRGAQGIGAVAISPDGRHCVLGIQRGGRPPASEKTLSNTYLAVYDLVDRKYVATVYMASSETKRVSEIVYSLAYSPDGKTLYAGMFQATTGIRVIDPVKWQHVADIPFKPNAKNKSFPHTNPLGLAFYREWLLVANRENQEILVIEPGARETVARLHFADGKHDFHRVVVAGDRIYVADRDAVYELDGATLTRRLALRRAKSDDPLEITLRVRED